MWPEKHTAAFAAAAAVFADAGNTELCGHAVQACGAGLWLCNAPSQPEEVRVCPSSLPFQLCC